MSRSSDRCLLALLGLLAWAGPAHAHQASIAHSTVRVHHGQRAVDYRLELSAASAAEILALPAATAPTAEDIRGGRDRLAAHVWSRIEIRDGARACPAAPGSLAVVREHGGDVAVAWTARCAGAISTLVLAYELFFDTDPQHRGLARIEHRGESALVELTAERRRFTWDLGAPPPASGPDFVVSGMEHILFGFDHIAFLLCLLLAVVLRQPPGMRLGWEARGLRQSWRHTALIVTSFTLAHSLTLIAASLGWIAIDSRLVESVIAASIVYVAVENMVKPDAGHRNLVTFGFGLIHGMGFASMLAALLPPGSVVQPLLLFNVGVELGQLAIVVVALPLMHAAVRLAGARLYRLVLLPCASGILAALGALWLVERVFDLTLLGF